MNEKKLEEAELKSITDLQKQYNHLILKIGSIEANLHVILSQKQELEKEKNQFFNELNKINEAEKNLVEILEKKYGSGDIDVEKGIITSP